MKKLLSALLIVFLLLPAPLQAMGSRKIPAKPAIGLALGSGGAVGLAHIAMLQVFDDLKVKPARIAGSSIGAVIGALYAAGLGAAEIHAIFDEFGGSKIDALSRLVDADAGLSLGDLLEFDLGNGGLIDPSGFLDFLAGQIEARTFADLDIPFQVVATDYWTGDAVILDEGDLFTAIRASMAVPGLFSPVRRGDSLLIDGGIANPLPFDLLAGRYDLVVAIDVSGSRRPNDGDSLAATDIYFSAFEIMQQTIIAEKMRSRKPDIYIKPAISDVRLLHFNRIKSIMQQSRPAAEQLRRELSEAQKAAPGPSGTD